MESLGINAVQLGAQFVNILILFVVLKKLVYKPLLKMLEERQKTIASGLAREADYAQKEAELKAKEAELIKQNQLKADRLAKKAVEDANIQAKEILSKARTEATKIKAEAKQSADKQLEKIQKQMDDKVLAAATDLANKALAQVLEKDTRAKVTESQIAKLQKIWQKSTQ